MTIVERRLTARRANCMFRKDVHEAAFSAGRVRATGDGKRQETKVYLYPLKDRTAFMWAIWGGDAINDDTIRRAGIVETRQLRPAAAVALSRLLGDRPPAAR